MAANQKTPLASLRIDKWLWCARFFKTRSLATQAIHGGHVKLNGYTVKPARDLRVGDVLDIAIGEVKWTVAVRGLATGAIDVRDTVPLVLKELRVGLVLGTFYGVIIAVVGYLMHDSIQLGQVVGLTVLGNMTGAALLAVLLPMIFQRLKVDPAVATGPFVTTAIDIFGVLNYFVIASWIYKF